MRNLTLNIARNHDEARKHEIRQMKSLSPQQRQGIARALKIKVYGTEQPDVRQTKVFAKRSLSSTEF
jgi:cell envelope opacity-associated protein A